MITTLTLLERSTSKHRAMQAIKDPDILIHVYMTFKYARRRFIFLQAVFITGVLRTLIKANLTD